MHEVDLNCDMGESFGNYSFGNDAKLMQYITSANIACGFHAGDAAVMQQTVAAGIQNNITIGAHPGLQDLPGFGRRNISITPAEAYQITIYQVSALAGFVKIAGGRLHHVKPHGALYNMAATDKALAAAIAKAVADLDSSLILYGLAGSELVNAGISNGLKTANEVFADRSYQADGTLTPRTLPGAVLTDPEAALTQVINMIKENKIICNDQTVRNVQADTICIHGDHEHSVEFAKFINNALVKAGVRIRSL